MSLSTNEQSVASLAGHSLGTNVVHYDERDAILYALAVGAKATDLDLVYERDLRVLPSYGLALGVWAVEAAAALGVYDSTETLHASQSLTVHRALPVRGPLSMTGRIAAVWDKGKAALVDIEATCDEFTAVYSIYVPGAGGWGGERGPAGSGQSVNEQRDWHGACQTSLEQAALYRLTGDEHPVHIDPELARGNGFDRPILHGLCTLGFVAREVAGAADAHPCDLRELTARFAAPVLPGALLNIAAGGCDGELAFDTTVDDTVVLKGGRARFEA